MKFTLTYEGDLQTGGNKVVRKHARRRLFHHQLKRLWEVNSLLKNWALPVSEHSAAPAPEVLMQQFGTLRDFQFVPLISKHISVEAALHFHILRPTTFKGQTRDIDNIVKTLMDSLRRPQEAGELPDGAQPVDDEMPFFVLLQDDDLVSKITSVGDELLQPVCGKMDIGRSDARVMIDVYIRPNFPNNANLIFFSDDFEVWNHRWSHGVPEDVRGWSNAELKSRTTQCILRMRVTASNFRMQRSATFEVQRQNFRQASEEERRAARERETNELFAQSDEQHMIWNSRLRPIAMALKEELLRRIHGEPPYPYDTSMLAIDQGMLAGVDPISEAAGGLESLIRQLP